jgi:ubiquinone/menaquinone biosynthesis C-methylase UbiE
MVDDSKEISSILEETKEYYRQRAAQFADWNRGKYDGGADPDSTYFEETKILLDALQAENLRGMVLEIASGTGIWTELLAQTAESVTALDSSPEMLERCRSRLGENPRVRYVVADFYDWVPDREYDAVSFSFWISHVPASKLDQFVSKLSDCLKPGGKVFFVDQQTREVMHEDLVRSGGEVAWRTLDNGKRFKVVKHFYTPEEIRESFLAHRIRTKITCTPAHFFYVQGEKIPDARDQLEKR